MINSHRKRRTREKKTHTEEYTQKKKTYKNIQEKHTHTETCTQKGTHRKPRTENNTQKKHTHTHTHRKA